MRLIVERVVLLLCACAGITAMSDIQDVCVRKMKYTIVTEVCNLVSSYCILMGIAYTKFGDEEIDSEVQCPRFCHVRLLTETFVTCDECQDNEGYENCPISANLKIVEDTLVIGEDLFRALHTLPYGFFVSKSTIESAGQGIFTQIDLPGNLRFGPYEGSIHGDDFNEHDANLYSWTIRRPDAGVIQVNALNVSYSNWLRYVNMPNCQKDGNMIAVNFNMQMYYITLKPIQAGSELLVWYGENYANYLGLDQYECNLHEYELI